MPGISIALSGGGHRASLFGLGALMYLVDTGKNAEVTSIASVSGGSLTNAYIAQEMDFQRIGSEDFRTTMKPFVIQLAHRGTVFASPFTWVYLAVSALIGLAVVAAIASLIVDLAVGIPGWVKAVVVVGGVPALGSLALARGKVCGRAFRELLFTKAGSATKLSEINRSIDHVICATDLHAGENVYFSGRFVCSYRFGWGTPGSIPLHVPVQASAALPGAFPPRWVPTRRFGFVDPQDEEARDASHLVLTDGGVYDNMADQWGQDVEKRNRDWVARNPGLHVPDELIAVNSSAGLSFTKKIGKLAWPIVGEIASLLRDKDVLYDNGTSVRRKGLVARFDLAAHEGNGLRGSLVHIPQTPLTAADAFLMKASCPDRTLRAQTVIDKFGGDRDEWKATAKANSAVKTTLSKMSVSIAARLMRHGYALAAANLHVILGYPLLDVPLIEEFEALCQEGR